LDILFTLLFAIFAAVDLDRKALLHIAQLADGPRDIPGGKFQEIKSIRIDFQTFCDELRRNDSISGKSCYEVRKRSSGTGG
jgi:hypothetical protein